MKSSGEEKITPEAFYQQLGQAGGPGLVAFARWVMDNAPAHGLSVIWGTVGPLLKFAHEKHAHLPFMFGQLDKSGVLRGYPKSILGVLRVSMRRLGNETRVGSRAIVVGALGGCC